MATSNIKDNFNVLADLIKLMGHATTPAYNIQAVILPNNSSIGKINNLAMFYNIDTY